VTVTLDTAKNIAVNTTGPPPDGPSTDVTPTEPLDDSTDAPFDQPQRPQPPDLEDTKERILDAMNVSDKRRAGTYVRVQPTGQPRAAGLESLRIYYAPGSLGTIQESTLEVWRYSEPQPDTGVGAWRNVGRQDRGHPSSRVSLPPQYSDIALEDGRYVSITNDSDTATDLLAFQFVRYHVFAPLGDGAPGTTPTAQPTATATGGATDSTGTTAPGPGPIGAIVAIAIAGIVVAGKVT
jgi:hypothetical protein